MLNKIKAFQKAALAKGRDANSMNELKMWLQADEENFFERKEEEGKEEEGKEESEEVTTKDLHEEDFTDSDGKASEECQEIAEGLLERWFEREITLKEMHHEIEEQHEDLEEELEDIIYDAIDEKFNELMEHEKPEGDKEEIKELDEDLHMEE